MKQKPDLSFWKLWNLSFGFFGVQIAYALQSANISSIFRTLGADPHDLSFFWILPPLMGMLVQPIIGTLSDRTWTRFGRRIPYLFIGAAVAVAVMCLLPNAGSLKFSPWILGDDGMYGVVTTLGVTILFGLLMLMLLDTSLNMAMQPFKMLVGDMVNEKQKGKAYSIQSFLCNAGSVVGFILPFLFTWLGVKNEAEKGVVPDSVIWAFYVGAAILILCVFYTVLKVREWNPKEYAEYNSSSEKAESKASWLKLLKNAPSNFWRIGLVQFFCWAAFLYMWSYVVDAVSLTVWDTAKAESAEYQTARNWTGVLYAIQALGAVGWAVLIPRFANMKKAYSLSLLLGACGFALIPFCPNQYLQIIPFLLIGCAWAAMLACPFTLVTNALQGYGHMGAYLGLFNCAICLPQIIAAVCGGMIFNMLGGLQTNMMFASTALLVAGSLSVFAIKGNK